MYGINVKFKEYSGWSSSYTYLSEVPYEKGQILVVPAGNWYGVVKVISCKENPKLKEGIKYKHVLAPLELYEQA
jgi:hypothetical protein